MADALPSRGFDKLERNKRILVHAKKEVNRDRKKKGTEKYHDLFLGFW
jgi:hypothetical protein